MQGTLYKTVDAEVSLSDSECRTLFIRKRMQGSLYRTADARIYQTANAGPFLGDSGCSRHSIIIVNAGLFLSDSYVGPSLTDSGCRRNFPDSGCSNFSIRQEMQESLYHSDSRCCIHFIGQRMQETIYQAADAEDILSGSRCRYSL